MLTCGHVGSHSPVIMLQISSTWQPSSQSRSARSPHVKRGTGSNTPTSGSKEQSGLPRFGTHMPSSGSQISPSAQSDSTWVAHAKSAHGPLGTTHCPT